METHTPHSYPLNSQLVSVIVLSYNSSKYIAETLESIKNQTYSTIELIISDDASTDSTCDLCHIWLKENSQRFNGTRLLQSPTNTGVTASCNRGLEIAQGAWIKFIAGDDLLTEDCLSNNMNFVNSNPDVHILFSNAIKINANGEVIGPMPTNAIKMRLSAKEQYSEMLKQQFVLTPTAFLRRTTIDLLGGFNESIPFIEDYPFWLLATQSGIQLSFQDLITVKYRDHQESITGKVHKKDHSVRKRWMESMARIYDQSYLDDLKQRGFMGLFRQRYWLAKAYIAFVENKTLLYWSYITFSNLTAPSLYHQWGRFKRKLDTLESNQQFNTDK